MAAERWLPVVGFANYEVSDLGQVRRTTDAANTYAGRILRPGKNRGGYPHVCLNLGGSGQKVMQVHRLVTEAFLGPLPAGHETHHADFDQTNNALINLSYITHQANVKHSVNAGRWKTNNHKLTPVKVRELRKHYDAGDNTLDIARRFGVSRGQVYLVGKRLHWPNVTEEAA